MNILKFRVLLISLSILASSCAIHNGYINNSASLSEANFRYVQTNISGTAEAKYILGIGGMNRTALVSEAKREMLRKYPLKSNEALVNTTVNWKTSNILGIFFAKQECTVTADIVSFQSSSEYPSDENQIQNSNANTNDRRSQKQSEDEANAQTDVDKKFNVGDEVQYWKGTKKIRGVIYKIENEDYHIRYTKANGAEKTLISTDKWLVKIN